MSTRERIEAGRMVWHVPPVCQGQSVVVAYAADGERVYRRDTDTSRNVDDPRRVTYYAADWVDGAEWQPWSDEPEGFAWRALDGDAAEDAARDGAR